MKSEYDTIRDEGGVKIVILEEQLSDKSYVYSVKVTYTNEFSMERDFEVISEDFTNASDLAHELSRCMSIL
jgi:hypothetical protein